MFGDSENLSSHSLCPGHDLIDSGLPAALILISVFLGLTCSFALLSPVQKSRGCGFPVLDTRMFASADLPLALFRKHVSLVDDGFIAITQVSCMY